MKSNIQTIADTKEFSRRPAEEFAIRSQDAVREKSLHGHSFRRLYASKFVQPFG
jgi:hypothetical protein